MRSYELMMITRGDLDEKAVASNIERFTKLIADRGGSVDGVDHWGKRASPTRSTTSARATTP